MSQLIKPENFWKRVESNVKSGKLSFDSLTNNQIYELIWYRNSNTLPRLGLSKIIFPTLPAVFSQKSKTCIRSLDRKFNRKAMKNVTPFEFETLGKSLTFPITNLLSDEKSKLFKAQDSNIKTSSNPPSHIDIQRMRRRYKREHGIF